MSVCNSSIRKKGFFEEGSRVVCAVCGETASEYSSIVSCNNCGNSAGGMPLLKFKNKRNENRGSKKETL